MHCRLWVRACWAHGSSLAATVAVSLSCAKPARFVQWLKLSRSSTCWPAQLLSRRVGCMLFPCVQSLEAVQDLLKQLSSLSSIPQDLESPDFTILRRAAQYEVREGGGIRFDRVG